MHHSWTPAKIPSQDGKLAIVTGGNSGIGWHTAMELARAGAEVILTARAEAKGAEAVAKIRHEFPAANARYEILDLANLASIRAFAARINNEPKLDLLVNNAGVMNVPKRKQTADGFELQFGTNYLGPFALTLLLLPVLKRASSPRVTTVSSGAANMGMKKINFDDLQSEKGYGGWRAYCQTKLADLIFSQELARRCAAAKNNILSNAAHPGYARTNLQTSGPGRELNAAERIVERFLSQDALAGALPTLRAATTVEATAGTYFAPDGFMQLKGGPIAIAVPAAAKDPAVAQRLWKISEQLTGVEWSA